MCHVTHDHLRAVAVATVTVTVILAGVCSLLEQSSFSLIFGANVADFCDISLTFKASCIQYLQVRNHQIH